MQCGGVFLGSCDGCSLDWTCWHIRENFQIVQNFTAFTSRSDAARIWSTKLLEGTNDECVAFMPVCSINIFMAWEVTP